MWYQLHRKHKSHYTINHHVCSQASWWIASHVSLCLEEPLCVFTIPGSPSVICEHKDLCVSYNRVHIVGDRDNALMCDQVDLSEYGNLSSVETLGISTMGLSPVKLLLSMRLSSMRVLAFIQYGCHLFVSEVVSGHCRDCCKDPQQE